jgi:hypothetical protein
MNSCICNVCGTVQDTTEVCIKCNSMFNIMNQKDFGLSEKKIIGQFEGFGYIILQFSDGTYAELAPTIDQSIKVTVKEEKATNR